MQRKFNYTGRKKIARYRYAVICRSHESGHYTFEVTLNFGNMVLPDDAFIFVEAYYRTDYMRFDFGTAGNISPPLSTLLTQIEEGVVPRFRIKVVKESKILAAADRVAPALPEDEEKEKTSLLPVEYNDIGDRVWKLEIDDEPVLILNETIDGIKNIARSEPAFLSLVYPEVIRHILDRIVRNGYTDDEEDWENRWVTFAMGLGVPKPPEGAGEAHMKDKEEWVDDAANAFAKKIKARAILVGSLLGDSG